MITVFENNTEANRDLVNSTLAGLSAQGSAVIAALNSIYESSLTELDRKLSSVNARRARGNRVATTLNLAEISTADFRDIDQSQTTATTRIDAGTVTLRETSSAQPISIQLKQFTSDSGTVQTFGKLSQVLMQDNASTPIGSFKITLSSPVLASFLLMDIAATPSLPNVIVQVSSDDTTYLDAVSLDVQGYRVTAKLPTGQVRFIKVKVSPTHPDNLDGLTYTFGVTDVSLALVQYQVLSELSSRPILIIPRSSSFRFIANADPGVLFYLSINQSPFAQVTNGQAISVPGASDVTLPGVGLTPNTQGLLLAQVPFGYYANSLHVVDSLSGTAYPVVQGLDPTLPGISFLLNQYIVQFGQTLNLAPVSLADAARTFTVSYTTGPASFSVRLRVQLTSIDRILTPAFRGAVFQEI